MKISVATKAAIELNKSMGFKTNIQKAYAILINLKFIVFDVMNSLEFFLFPI